MRTRGEIIVEANNIKLAQLYEDARKRHDGLLQLALLALKSLVALNGGAIVALFTLLGHVESLSVRAAPLWWGFAAFAGGLTFAVLSNVIGYLAQDQFFDIEGTTAEQTYVAICNPSAAAPHSPAAHALAVKTHRVALVMMALSLIGFVAGAGLSLAAVRVADPPAIKAPSAPVAQPASPRPDGVAREQ